MGESFSDAMKASRREIFSGWHKESRREIFPEKKAKIYTKQPL